MPIPIHTSTEKPSTSETRETQSATQPIGQGSNGTAQEKTKSEAELAAEKLYGSAWQFRWTDGDQSRIQFHEPHPYSKIPFVVARRIGRRLNRNYGWTGDIFVLKGTE